MLFTIPHPSKFTLLHLHKYLLLTESACNQGWTLASAKLIQRYFSEALYCEFYLISPAELSLESVSAGLSEGTTRPTLYTGPASQLIGVLESLEQSGKI